MSIHVPAADTVNGILLNLKMDPIEEKLKLLRPVLSPQKWDYLRVQYIFEKDFKKKKEIENLIDFLIAQHVPGLKIDNMLLPPPEKRVLVGDIPSEMSFTQINRMLHLV
jgi:hypothetical protein